MYDFPYFLVNMFIFDQQLTVFEFLRNLIDLLLDAGYSVVIGVHDIFEWLHLHIMHNIIEIQVNVWYKFLYFIRISIHQLMRHILLLNYFLGILVYQIQITIFFRKYDFLYLGEESDCFFHLLNITLVVFFDFVDDFALLNVALLFDLE